VITRIALVASDVFVRRLTPALASFVRMRRDFRIVDIHRSPGELRDRIRELRPDGIITESLPRRTAGIVAMGIPTVIADTDDVYPNAVSIDVNDREVGATAARFFQNAGYLHFACVTNGMPYSEQRLGGFRSAIAESAETFHEFTESARRPQQYMELWNVSTERLRAWLMRLPKPVGVFAVHDPLGRLVSEAAIEAGLHVPEEVAVVGANNDELVCGLSHPPLSSVDIVWSRIGALAGGWVQRLIAGEAAPDAAVLVNPGPVVVRQSTTLVAVEDPDLRRVLRYFGERFSSPMSIAGVCSELRLSRRAIERKFSLHLRETPWECLSRVRVEAAKWHLINTDRDMGTIAEACGFANAEQLAVIFRRCAGLTPRDYRKSTRA
jgi:LacI family transcriptional regulator